MKKNWIAKVAVLMLALTMITSCFVGSTFAKYITKAEGTDTARVAKWGILLTVSGNAFDYQYKTHETEDEYGYDGEYSVIAENEKDALVAPGTSSDDLDANLVATVKGKPEVATRYTLTAEKVEDVVLPAGTYTDYTQLVKADDGTYGYTGEFELKQAYTPVKWNLLITKGTTEFNVAEDLYTALSANPDLLQKAEALGFSKKGCSIFSAIEILKKVAPSDTYTQVVETALGNVVTGGRNFQLDIDDEGKLVMSYDFDPNKDMDFTFELTWAWEFSDATEQYEITLNDQADTFLGNIAAGVASADGASVKIAANVTATATQID